MDGLGHVPSPQRLLRLPQPDAVECTTELSGKVLSVESCDENTKEPWQNVPSSCHGSQSAGTKAPLVPPSHPWYTEYRRVKHGFVKKNAVAMLTWGADLPQSLPTRRSLPRLDRRDVGRADRQTQRSHLWGR